MATKNITQSKAFVKTALKRGKVIYDDALFDSVIYVYKIDSTVGGPLATETFDSTAIQTFTAGGP